MGNIQMEPEEIVLYFVMTTSTVLIPIYIATLIRNLKGSQFTFVT